MKDLALKLFVRIGMLKDENGQDMVEYAIVMGLIALGATVAMNGLATSTAAGFTSAGAKVTSYTS